MISPPLTDYQTVACSADGTKLIASLDFGTLEISTNSGTTWSPTIFENGYWNSLASSANGNKLFAGADNLFISTNSGVTWSTNYSPNGYSTGVACSADGTKVAVASGGDEPILLSTNSGASFTSNTVPGDGFCSIVSSADGTKLAGMLPSQLTFPQTSDGGHFPIYQSIDSGATWTQTKAPVIDWVGLACSTDGETLAAVSGGGILAISRDSGLTWTTNTIPGVWTVACSADGTRLIAAQGDKGDYQGVIFTSLDSGRTWITNNVPIADWTDLAMSADGSFMVASAIGYGTTNGGIYTLHIPAQPSLKICPIGSNLQLSWPLPSAGFVLQQSSQLNSTNWVNMTNAVVASGYYNQVTVSPPQTGNAYYRLVNQQSSP